MKIKLLNDIPFVEDNELAEGKVVEVVEAPRLLEKPRGEEKWVKGADGDHYRVYVHEYEVVEE